MAPVSKIRSDIMLSNNHIVKRKTWIEAIPNGKTTVISVFDKTIIRSFQYHMWLGQVKNAVSALIPEEISRRSMIFHN